ncbi:uncharacterized protein UV8b_01853 [Ustilaginoidea virens]|uniref:Alpha-galactosidase n=1 Tax=Ustilaginoidea virens TaxID=1159556 RepID=A0A8E5MFB6_USTVR|nr:uncharacterized protein UV8b_01853 [Ustilaginoidea virens]QUC17612.1 hypothetical protein UV8b_01853 [Ustilaginoidea virens]
MESVVVDAQRFALNGKAFSYRFHADEASGDLISDHFGGPVTELFAGPAGSIGGGWSSCEHLRREFPDLGRGDFRSPAVRITQAEGHTVSAFKYVAHEVSRGKPRLPGLPATFGTQDEVTTLVVQMYDSVSALQVDLRYSVFAKHDALARSATVTNKSDKPVVVEKLASFSTDLPYDDYDMLQLRGEWVRECTRTRRKVDYGTQGFGSTTGYSSHYNNPFLALVQPATTESQGNVWAFSLIYSGSFGAEVEMGPRGLTRVLMGMNHHQLAWPLQPGESLTSPECVSIFSADGIGDMSRKLHRLYRENLIRSPFVDKPRPVLLNSWEGLYFEYDEHTIYTLAQDAAKLGVKLLVLDDGWFGVKYPRVDDGAGLGDWEPNPSRFPHGLKSIADKVRRLPVANSSSGPDGQPSTMQFGIWVEPEMVNPQSELYERHPDWVLCAGDYPRTESRQQLVLNLALGQVQDFVIDSVSRILASAPITYVKWDNNRGMHETPSPRSYHAYMLGLYRVLDTLTARFPHVLWEGCASGGGRFDPGMLHYFPQSWTSDNTDAHDRLAIQFGASLAHPASSMGAHVGAVPYGLTGRSTSVSFRAHVAMMGGSFGLELDPARLPDRERRELPALIALAEKVNPVVVRGDMWRLRLPGESNFPAALFVSEDGGEAVLFLFQVRSAPVHNCPILRLQGLDPAARYRVDGGRVYSGATLMNGGIAHEFQGDYASRVMLLERL